MISTELESKYCVDFADFEALKSAGRIKSATEQLNVYYDCEQKLSQSSATFRIRFRSGSVPLMTLKMERSMTGACRESVEIEKPLSISGRPASHQRHIVVDRDLPRAFAKPLSELGIATLQRVGWMRNMRWMVAVSDEHTIELDRTHLPDGSVNCEVEIENGNPVVHALLAGRVCDIASSATPSTLSKFQRFLEATNRSRQAGAGVRPRRISRTTPHNAGML